MKVLPYNCLFILSAIIATIGSCGRSGSEIASIVEERDSLRNISERQTRRLANLDTLILAINEGLDTIARGEAGIFINGVTEGVNTKDEIFANINRLSQVIEQQRKQLDKFEKHLIEDEEEHGKKTGISFRLGAELIIAKFLNVGASYNIPLNNGQKYHFAEDGYFAVNLGFSCNL